MDLADNSLVKGLSEKKKKEVVANKITETSGVKLKPADLSSKNIKAVQKGEEGSGSQKKLYTALAATLPTLIGAAFGGTKGAQLGAQQSGNVLGQISQAGVKEQEDKEKQERKLAQIDAQNINRQSDRRADQEFQLKLKGIEGAQKIGLKEMDIANKPKVETPFTKEKLKQYGKAAVEYNTRDRANLVNNATKITEARALIGKKGDLAGPIRGRTPDFIRNITNPDAINARQLLQSAITDTLRPTLGAQFTENEGKRIMSLQYNDDLSDEVNDARAQKLEEFIQRKVQATDALFKYIQENGTDEGFPFGDFGMMKSGSSPASSSLRVPEEMTDDELDARLAELEGN